MRKRQNGSSGSGIQQQQEATEETGAANTKSSRWFLIFIINYIKISVHCGLSKLF
jgi:hypothetical protein